LEAGEDSDYDVLVILKEVKPSIRRKIYDIAWEIGFEYDVLIVPVFLFLKRWRK
jgi:predicted nucleotidyltransferase